MRPPPTRIGNGGRYFRTNASMGPESRSSDTPAISKSLRSNSRDRKSTRLNSSHGYISYAVFCLKKKKIHITQSASFCSGQIKQYNGSTLNSLIRRTGNEVNSHLVRDCFMSNIQDTMLRHYLVAR